MKCMHINIKQASLILLTFVINRIQMDSTQMMGQFGKDFSKKNVTYKEDESDSYDPVLQCSSSNDTEWKNLNEPCIECDLKNLTCQYGKPVNVSCWKKHSQMNHKGPTFQRNFTCRYCYQTEHWEHTCELKANCNSASTPRATYITNCTVNEGILCLGYRTFNKKLKCNWTSGYYWSYAIVLSITLGGFGADRFYLGHWQEGIGKLFSFGGLGVWTIIDVILISLHYLGPANGSLYI